MNETNQLEHEKIIGIQQKINIKEIFKKKGCANPTCNKNAEDIEKLLYCSFCLTVAYCSSTCQR